MLYLAVIIINIYPNNEFTWWANLSRLVCVYDGAMHFITGHFNSLDVILGGNSGKTDGCNFNLGRGLNEGV